MMRWWKRKGEEGRILFIEDGMLNLRIKYVESIPRITVIMN